MEPLIFDTVGMWLMELSLESDADALWQDTLDLLSQESLPEAVLAMLRNCTPVRIEDNILYVTTPMRLVLKTVSKNLDVVEKCLTTAAFEKMALSIEFAKAPDPSPVSTNSTVSQEQVTKWSGTNESHTPARVLDDDAWNEEEIETENKLEKRRRRQANPLVEDISQNDSKLTFDRFIIGDENKFAYQAALQVANGENKSYNPLFIYGKSGLGKTHLLRAIQNYIAKNDSSRICVYKTASDFITDYTDAIGHKHGSAPDILTQNYCDIDVLIIDDIQNMAGAARTLEFFFNTFNVLISKGKQIVLAADRSPAQLGMGKDGFDERVTSRLDSGFPISIQVPSYELKYLLISTFCERMNDDAKNEHIGALTATISEDNLRFMTERAGTNIRVIEGFCQKCLIVAAQCETAGRLFSREDILKIAKEKWPNGHKQVTIDEIQKVVENYYDIPHKDLVGGKRNKELMEPRHVAIWLTRELTDTTLADIGKRFGGRSHATVKHSISVVEEARKQDKNFYDRVSRIQDSIVENN